MYREWVPVESATVKKKKIHETTVTIGKIVHLRDGSQKKKKREMV